MRTAEVAIFLVRRRREEVLVVRRARELGGYWHVIAGGVEAAESWQEAAKRELYEEAGWAPDADMASCARCTFTYAVANEDDSSAILRAPAVSVECVLLEVPDDYEPTLNWEHCEYRWATFEEALSLFHWSNIRDALRQLIAA